MAKIVIMGAGSRNFAKNIITDVVLYPELADSTIALMDIDKERLELTTDFARTLIKQHGLKTKIESTTNRREALAGADYVIVTISVGGRHLNDIGITEKYGIPWDDTMGPCGVFQGSRQAQAIVDIAHDMEKVCPNAWLLNYSNPQGMICWSLNDYTRIKNVGLCPNNYNMAEGLARWAGVPFEETSWWCAGINHFSFYLEFKWRGNDAYPLLRERLKDPAVYMKPDSDFGHVDLVEFEMFKRFGYFTNGGSGHIGYYVPYFWRTPELRERFGANEAVDLATRMMKKRMDDEEDFKRKFSSGYKFPLTREYRWTIWAVNVIHSLETGQVRRINCNVKNDDIITNLTQGCCVEVPCLVDKEGVHPCHIGALPPQIAALVQSNVNVQELAVRGVAEKDKNKMMQAVLLDPLTSAVLSIDETVKVVEELFQSEKEYLRGFK
jgi:alpha-galactosidase